MKPLAVLAALLPACVGAGLRGASAVDPEKEPNSRATAVLHSRDCRDERGGMVANVTYEYVYIERSSGPRLLLERRAGHDSVLVENSYADGSELVFAYVSGDAKQPDVLHEVRLSRDARNGELRLSRAFETHDTNQGFRAKARRVVLRCALASSEVHADAAHTDAGS
ncbi:MAG: hypothetical protein ACOY0T_25270 [Myxococcota bacterium]